LEATLAAQALFERAELSGTWRKGDAPIALKFSILFIDI
jgi:hypothetical protein